MNKFKKIRLLEFLIILIIAISIIIIYIAFTKINKEKPLLSNSEEVVNYKVTKYYEYFIPLEQANTYHVPYLEKADPDNSKIKITLKSIDNYINDYRETINIIYLNLANEEKNSIINYCNSYDEIESLYSIRCTFKNNNLQIDNLYHVSKLLSSSLTIKDFNINIPIDKKTKTNDYLNYLTDNNIGYVQLKN